MMWLNLVRLGLVAAFSLVSGTVVAQSAAPSDSEVRGLALRQAQLFDRNGQPYTLTQRPDQVLIVNQWGFWCAPCLTEMPIFKALRDKVGEDHVKIVLLTTSEKDWTKDLAKIDALRLPFDAALYRARSASEERAVIHPMDIPFLSVAAIPRTMVFSPSGKVVAEFGALEGDLSSLLNRFEAWSRNAEDVPRQTSSR